MKKDSYAIGGQAVLEGVMLKSKKNLVVCARNPKGKIVSMHKKLKKQPKWKNWFFLRGIVNLFSMLKLGMDALVWSGNVASGEDEEIKAKDWIIMITVSVLFVLAFFIVLPFFLTRVMTTDKGIFFNIIDGLLRILLFVLYVAFISLSKDIKAVYQYHGAEHKAVHCYEEMKDVKKVTVKACKKYSPVHPRCGSTFLMIVLIISILIFSAIPSESIWIRLVSRVILIPVIIGLSYEFLKFAAKHQKNFMIRILVWPGVALQRLTTKEPTAKQQEVGIAALKKLVKLDK